MKKSKEKLVSLDSLESLDLPKDGGFYSSPPILPHEIVIAQSELLLAELQKDPEFELRRLRTKVNVPFVL